MGTGFSSFAFAHRSPDGRHAGRHLLDIAGCTLALVLVLANGCAQPSVAGVDACAGSNCTGAPVDLAPGGCKVDKDCASGLSCEPVSGRCVACINDAYCPDGQRCDTSTFQCVVGCSAVHGCGDLGLCEVDAGTCVECRANSDCNLDRPFCDPIVHQCFACLPPTVSTPGTCGPGTYCARQGSSAACMLGCSTDDDCPPADGAVPADGGAWREVMCDQAQHQCVYGCTIPNSCGACGNVCLGGWNCCAGGCSNPTDDIMNCGDCNLPCVVANATPACVVRKCTIGSCHTGYGDCNASPLDGCEIDITSNVNHCGKCGSPCAIAHAMPKCVGGQCGIDTCVAPWGDCNQLLGDGCETNVMTSDVGNCGGCGVTCSTNHITATCLLGACNGACDPGYADCNGDKQSDGCETIVMQSNVMNCGGCGLACSANNIAALSCTAGNCDGACTFGYADCNGNKQTDGCEIAIASDVNNCGACGARCSAQNIGSPTCTNGACDAACNFGFADCDLNKQSNGCETSLLTDANNCGACMTSCSTMNIAVPTCASGMCNGACNLNYADCNNDKLRDGCEISTLDDPLNCGGCAMACSTNNITATCGGGQCNGTCVFGYSDCNGDKRRDGCEVFVGGGDVTNCGGCGVACSSNHITNATCDGGMCDGACDSGWGDCDFNKQGNGCEAALTTTVNCGMCGVSCGLGELCSNGACVLPDMGTEPPDMAQVCHVVVNEVMTGTTAFASEEFVEVYNPCPTSLDLTGFRIAYRPASDNGETIYFSFTAPLASHAYFVVGGAKLPGAPDGRAKAGAGLLDGGGAVGLRDANGLLFDSVAYGNAIPTHSFAETTVAPAPPVVASPGNSISRIPDGTDTNNNAMDFKISTAATPGAANR